MSVMPAAAGSYAAFAEQLLATGILSDPWLDGRPRFRPEPEILSSSAGHELFAAAEAVAAAYDELVRLSLRDPALLDGIFDLTPWQRMMWLASAPLWHGIARADVFQTAGGLQVCELNSDTPSGEAEAVLLSRLAAAKRPELTDPNAGLATAFGDMVDTMARALVPVRGPLTVGVVYPTELTEDLSMIQLYRQWFETRGWRVVLGSPFNLSRVADGRAAMFGVPCDVFVRHYKTDWWGERQPVRNGDLALPDPEPLDGPLGVLLGAVLDGRAAVVNPFGAVVTQNKRSLAFFWEHLDRFPADRQAAIRRYLPPTFRLEALGPERLAAEREAWVLKSDYGCEGEEVVIGTECTPDEWAEVVHGAVARRWVAQRRFEPRRDADGWSVNWGVYVVAGRAVGLYPRVQRGATDVQALSVAALVEPDGS